MSRNLYKLWSFGPAVGIGVTGAMNVAMSGIAKKATASQAFVVSNEVVCNGLARALLLPCPPGALLEKDNEIYFFSLDFNLAGHALPPVVPAAVVRQNPSLAWGITLFDAFVMNADRHVSNMSHDRITHSIQIFDHSHAFLGSGGDLVSNLERRRTAISIGSHCLAPELNSSSGFAGWCARIKAVPDFYIDGIVDAACDVGIPSEHKALCSDVLKYRRDNIDELVRANSANFPKLPAGAI